MGETAPGLGEILAQVTLDPLWIAVLAAASGAYVAALRRLRAANLRVAHPWWKTLSFFGGLLALAAGVISPIEHYGKTFLWVDFLGFLAITMVAAPLLLLASPLTLAFRVSGPVGRRRLRTLYRSRLARVLTFPLVSGLLFASVTYAWQFSSLTDAAAQNNVLRHAQQASLLLVALIFWLPALCADPVRWRVGYPLRALYVAVEMTHKGLFGGMFLSMNHPVHTHMAARLPPYGPDAMTDQRMAILILWIGGNLIFLATLVGILLRWMQYESRSAERTDRRLERAREDSRRRRAALEQVFQKPV